MFHPYRCAFILLLTLSAFIALPCSMGSLPAADAQPGFKQQLNGDNGIPPMPAPRKIFGIGIGFERIGTAQGVALSQVLSGSPAERAGLAVGTVIAEINGVSTIGRTEEECVRMVRESSTFVKLKFLDPGTFLPRTITVRKESIILPN